MSVLLLALAGAAAAAPAWELGLQAPDLFRPGAVGRAVWSAGPVQLGPQLSVHRIPRTALHSQLGGTVQLEAAERPGVHGHLACDLGLQLRTATIPTYSVENGELQRERFVTRPALAAGLRAGLVGRQREGWRLTGGVGLQLAGPSSGAWDPMLVAELAVRLAGPR
jgi:hypothetical protein